MELENGYLRLKVEQWVNENISPYCSGCEDNCCNASKHLINIDKDEQAVQLFSQIGINIHRSGDLDKSSVINWMKNKLTGKVLTVDGTEVKKPSIIEAPIPEFGVIGRKMSKDTDYVLYAEFCPFYLKEKGCGVWGDPRRPRACKEYPLTFESKGDTRIIDVHNSCYAMKKPEIKVRLQQAFPDIQMVSVSGLMKAVIGEFSREQSRKRRRNPIKIRR